MAYLNRLSLYFNVMYPLPKAVITAIIVFLSFFLLIAEIKGDEKIFYLESWFAIASIFLYSIIFRINDEIKDEEFDKKYNPDRPLITGAVKFSDIQILAVILFGVITALNFNKGMVTSIFLVWIVFLTLSARWFYFKDEVIRPNFLLTTITHQPILPLTYLYIYSVYVYLSGGEFEFGFALALALLFSLTYIGWEVARKTRAPEEETEYDTYSKQWGVKKSTAIPMIYIALTTIGLVGMGVIFDFSNYFIAANILIGALSLMVYTRFLLNPTSKNNRLRMANELYDLGFRLLVIIEVLAGRLL